MQLPKHYLCFLAYICVLLQAGFSSAVAAVSVLDDTNHTVTLTTPAQRIISLGPHATELLYAAGAGSKIVGTIEYSDYPPEARHIPSVGSSTALDLERIIALKPDLLIAWGSGNSTAQVAKLRSLGIPVFDSDPRNFEAIASSLERLARLAGTEAVGRPAAKDFRVHLDKITTTYQHRPVVRVFYQVWREPLMTLNDTHIASAVIRLCGGQNIFGQLPQLAPTVDIEAVLNANPEVIVSDNRPNDDTWLELRRFPKLTAVARGNLFLIDLALLTRAGPRIIDGAEALCKNFDVARSRRKVVPM